MTGVQLKVGRALEHLLALDEAIARYLDGDPMDIVREIDDRFPGRVVLSLRLSDRPPVTLSTVIGDCVQNLRSSLDHLAARLVESSSGAVEQGPGGTQFPILLKRPAVGTPTIKGGVVSGALALVDSVQPYRRRDADNHPLAVLSRLSNMDKHRTVIVSLAQSVGTSAYLSAGDGSWRVGGHFDRDVVRPGEPLAAFQLPAGKSIDPSVVVEATGKSFVATAIGDPIDDRPVTEVLEEILNFVQFQVIARLEPFVG
jgi:hypothetical protein